MKLALIYQSCASFGQTEAGCHWVVGPEKIVRAIDIDCADEKEITSFMKEARIVYKTWGSKNPFQKELDITPCARVFKLVVRYYMSADKRKYKGHYRPTDGLHKLKIIDDKYVPDAGRLVIDGENLAYQRALLGR